MTVQRVNGGGTVVLPAAYVAEHVELGYASSAPRAQGRAVDTAHAFVTSTTTRETLYVLATRGRESNQLYVDTHDDPDPQTAHDQAAGPVSAKGMLTGVLHNEGADVAASGSAPLEPAIRSWLVTSGRVAGRLGDGRLHGYRWENAFGGRVDPTPGREGVVLDLEGQPTLVWYGAGAAPMGVAAVFHLYGHVAMIDHPGLAPLRVEPGALEVKTDHLGWRGK
jgi:hypothetical protein